MYECVQKQHYSGFVTGQRSVCIMSKLQGLMSHVSIPQNLPVSCQHQNKLDKLDKLDNPKPQTYHICMCALCTASSTASIWPRRRSHSSRAGALNNKRWACDRKPLRPVCFLPSQQESYLSKYSMPNQDSAVKAAETLSVLTLNIWGLWLVSKRRSERVRCVDHAVGVLCCRIILCRRRCLHTHHASWHELMPVDSSWQCCVSPTLLLLLFTVPMSRSSAGPTGTWPTT